LGEEKEKEKEKATTQLLFASLYLQSAACTCPKMDSPERQRLSFRMPCTENDI